MLAVGKLPETVGPLDGEGGEGKIKENFEIAEKLNEFSNTC